MYNTLSQSLVRAGLVNNNVALGNSIVDRPANHSTVPYSELNNFLNDNIPTGREFIYYFTLAKGFGTDTVNAEWWHQNFKKAYDASGCKVNFAYNLEYHSDGVTLHAHGMLWDNSQNRLNKFKKSLRKSFNIAPSNRVAIKYYQNNNINHTAMMKIKYHLTSTDYNNIQKDNYENQFTYYLSEVVTQERKERENRNSSESATRDDESNVRSIPPKP